MSSVAPVWNTELYEAKHSFVWHFGESLIELLAPQPGQRILDLGCGTGHLTHKIAESGTDAVGLDASPEMIGQARQNFPKIKFTLQSATSMTFQEEFDAVFSNAALHWIPEADKVAAGISAALKPGGRLVAELGGKGNIGHIVTALTTLLPLYYDRPFPDSPNYFPSVSQYTSVLESNGLEVHFAQLFDRPTPLEGESGMEDWLRQFKWFCFEPLSPESRKRALAEVIEHLRPALYRDGQWVADYRRLRIVAVKL